VAILHENAKQDYRRFLKVIIDELKRCEERPIIVSRNGKEVASSNIYLVCVIDDGIEQKSMMGHQGVGAKYGCQFGTCEGEHPDDKPKKKNHGMYFKKKNGKLRSIASLQFKDKSEHFVSNPFI
jgi:hypothetical protein